MRRVIGKLSRRALGFAGAWLFLQHGLPGLLGSPLPVQVRVAGDHLRERLEATFHWRTPPAPGQNGATTTVVAHCTRAASGPGKSAMSAGVTITSAPDGAQHCTTHQFSVDWTRETPPRP